ncbi:hypothetical protein A6B43_07950 [Vespertiliibacter pulmonis]|uniref:Type I restriction enzyme S subunit n=1 Tax=Vespertiliibacter pulmonis TaxID=1443036 RepID=A0A3N4VWT0_9PAST|nr:restriction endonuclease subunit S [Vespertiliibacter pulmonis]QLB21458.1 hypothetical protein A6B43_07950 [Vespertiliibacter pulmonis]RPE85873.1 type I restriction enzyme S subunit [Vespertiliibacter pulmonis]
MNKIPLNELVTLQRGFDLPKDKRLKGNVPVVASTGIVGYHNEAKVKANGVVLGRSGSIGGGQYIQENFFPLNTTLYVKDFKGHYPRFIYYLFRSIDFTQFNVGSGVPTLNRNHLSTILINNISYEEEVQIAKVLGDLDDKIQLNTQINQTLEQIAQAIFKSWFIDFDPVKAKINVLANGGTKNDAECAAMCVISGKTEAELTQLKDRQPEKYQELAKTAALFPSEMVESELGKIPKGWECKSISSICSMQNGYAFKSSEWSNDGLPVIKIGSIKPIIIDMDGIGYVHKKNESLRQEFLVKEGDILVGLTGYVGEVGRVPKNINAVLNQRTARFIPFPINSQYRYYCFIYCLSRSNKFKEYAITHAKGSAQANISTKELLNYQSVISCVNIHIEFEKVIFSLLEMILNNGGENNTLGKVRDELLPKILSEIKN